MGFRFSRRIKIMPGVRLNVGLGGTSLSVGPRGASVNVGRRGVHANVGIPGTGISVRERLDRPAPRASRAPAARSGPSVSALPASVRVGFGDRGDYVLLDENGWELDEATARAARAAFRDQIVGALAERAEMLNAPAGALDVHVGTLPPGPARAAAPEFVVPKPLRPADPRSVQPAEREQAEVAWSRYMEVLAFWRASKAEHEKRHGVALGREVIEAALERRLVALSWPRETLVSLAVEQEGALVRADVDLPELEDMPAVQATVNQRALKIGETAIGEPIRRRLYQRHVHAVLFRIVGEIFAGSPSTAEVRIAGYTQRVSSATGRTEDEYIVSVRVGRDEWYGIDFGNLAGIDPVAALDRFDRRCKVDPRGQMRTIVPEL